MNQRPIGIFDSGIGGLTVLKELSALLPNEEFIYLGDTARVPYGTKSGDTVVRYSIEISDFLSDYSIKLLVVACNTASAYALATLKERLTIPVVGVIEPGARMAAKRTKNGKIGVIGTEATIRSNAYLDAIKKIDTRIEVFMKACPLFVPLAEEGWTDNEVARLAARNYLGGLKDSGIDVLLLGCTHYPLLRGVIAEAAGPGVELVDSAHATAIEVRELLDSTGLSAGERKGSAPPRYFVTDSPGRFASSGKRFINSGNAEATLVRLGERKD